MMMLEYMYYNCTSTGLLFVLLGQPKCSSKQASEYACFPSA